MWKQKIYKSLFSILLTGICVTAVTYAASVSYIKDGEVLTEQYMSTLVDAINSKADINSVYTKAQIDEKIKAINTKIDELGNQTSACWTDLYKVNWQCLSVWNGYFSSHDDDTRSPCTNKPTNASYTSSWNGTNNCSWNCNSNYQLSNGQCVQKPINWECSNLPGECLSGTATSYAEINNSARWICEWKYKGINDQCYAQLTTCTDHRGRQIVCPEY